jgi:hypothetical protein
LEAGGKRLDLIQLANCQFILLRKKKLTSCTRSQLSFLLRQSRFGAAIKFMYNEAITMTRWLWPPPLSFVKMRLACAHAGAGLIF